MFSILGKDRIHILDLSPTLPSTIPVTKLAFFNTVDGVYDLSWSEFHDYFLVALIADDSLKIYDLSLPPSSNPIQSLQEHTREAHSTNWNPRNRDSFLSVSWMIPSIFGLSIARLQSSFKEHPYCVYSASWNPCHPDVFAHAFGDCIVMVLDVQDPGSTMIIPAHKHEIQRLFCKINEKCGIEIGDLCP